jgi:hypothetical protein
MARVLHNPYATLIASQVAPLSLRQAGAVREYPRAGVGAFGKERCGQRNSSTRGWTCAEHHPRKFRAGDKSCAVLPDVRPSIVNADTRGWDEACKGPCCLRYWAVATRASLRNRHAAGDRAQVSIAQRRSVLGVYACRRGGRRHGPVCRTLPAASLTSACSMRLL